MQAPTPTTLKDFRTIVAKVLKKAGFRDEAEIAEDHDYEGPEFLPIWRAWLEWEEEVETLMSNGIWEEEKKEVWESIGLNCLSDACVNMTDCDKKGYKRISKVIKEFTNGT